MKTKEEFNAKLLENIGLEIGDDGEIVDEETGDVLQFRGKIIKCGEIGKTDILFDPLENPAMMNKLFTYFINKDDEDTGIGTRTFAHGSGDRKEKNFIELKKFNNETIRSRCFYNDTLKYADIIFKMNNSVTNEDLAPLDAPVKRRGRYGTNAK